MYKLNGSFSSSIGYSGYNSCSLASAFAAHIKKANKPIKVMIAPIRYTIPITLIFSMIKPILPPYPSALSSVSSCGVCLLVTILQAFSIPALIRYPPTTTRNVSFDSVISVVIAAVFPMNCSSRQHKTIANTNDTMYKSVTVHTTFLLNSHSQLTAACGVTLLRRFLLRYVIYC